jgi:hypothetical protein
MPVLRCVLTTVHQLAFMAVKLHFKVMQGFFLVFVAGNEALIAIFADARYWMVGPDNPQVPFRHDRSLRHLRSRPYFYGASVRCLGDL